MGFSTLDRQERQAIPADLLQPPVTCYKRIGNCMEQPQRVFAKVATDVDLKRLPVESLCLGQRLKLDSIKQLVVCWCCERTHGVLHQFCDMTWIHPDLYAFYDMMRYSYQSKPFD